MSVNYGLFKSRFKKTIADAIYNEVIAKTARYYHFLGKENAWTDFLSPFIQSQDPNVGDVPGAPSDDFRYELHVRRDILTAKLISPSDISYVVPRLDWESGKIYDMYDDAINPGAPAASGAVRLEEAKFYVLTSEYNVYKCLYNNYGAHSTFEPTGTNPAPFTTGDGYKWKFMYTIPISLRNRFLSQEYMPVTTALKAPFYSDGEIVSVIIEDGGSGYINPQLIVSGKGYLKNNPYIIDSIKFKEDKDTSGAVIKTYNGKGYTSVPLITFANPTVISGYELLATGEVTISAGSIDTTTLLTPGYGYTADPSSPVITVEPPIAGASNFTINSLVSLGDILVANGNFYEVTTSGITGSAIPTHETGIATNGGCQLEFVGQQAVLEPVMEQTRAKLIPILGPGGEISGVTIDDGGTGYTDANIQVVDVVAPGQTPGSGAIIEANFNVGNVDTLQANVELLAVKGTIESMIVVNGGSGYGAATVTVLGDGYGCTATAQVAGGKVVSITITDPGYGYTWTDIVIGGNGTGAIVRAIMSPIGGHGYNAIDELNANSIMFYSSFSRDVNHGLTITNDYRKAGLLRNIKEFNSQNRFNDQLGTGCVLVTGVFDKTKLAYDQLLVQANATYKNYRIVEFSDTQILVSVFNNFTILPGETLVTPEGYTILVSDVKERTIDQFSGDFLFLTVREPFAPSEEQIITIRTVLTV